MECHEIGTSKCDEDRWLNLCFWMIKPLIRPMKVHIKMLSVPSAPYLSMTKQNKQKPNQVQGNKLTKLLPTHILLVYSWEIRCTRTKFKANIFLVCCGLLLCALCAAMCCDFKQGRQEVFASAQTNKQTKINRICAPCKTTTSSLQLIHRLTCRHRPLHYISTHSY